MIDLIFLGCGAGYKPSLGPTSAYFRLGKRLYVIDCGTSAFERLERADAFRGINSVTVFLSHLHADHAGSLSIFLDYCKDILHITPFLIHPGKAVLQFLDLAGVSRETYIWREGYEKPDENGILAEFFPADHVPGMDCYGYLIAEGSTDNFYFSGDAAGIPQKILERLFDGSLKRIYQDTASGNSKYHCPLEKLKTLAPEAYRSRVYCVHLDTDRTEIFMEAGFKTLAA